MGSAASTCSAAKLRKTIHRKLYLQKKSKKSQGSALRQTNQACDSLRDGYSSSAVLRRPLLRGSGTRRFVAGAHALRATKV